MSEVRPFSAVRYNTRAERDLSTRLSPPYDVLDAEGKAALLSRDQKNFVELDLPHVPPNTAGSPAAYDRSARTLNAWLAEGTLVNDDRESIYVYHQLFEHDGTRFERKMFFARLRLEPFGAGSVFAHEATFGGPKNDRLCLTKATAANLSPILGLYEDADQAVSNRLDAALSSEPLAFGTLDGIENRLWAVSDPAVVGDVVERMIPKALYIADGHHRYGTALMYRDWLVAEQGPLPEDHPANFLLCVFCAMESPGLLILPTHRVLPGVRVSREALESDGRIEVRTLPATDPKDIPAALGDFGPQAVGFRTAHDATCFVLKPGDPKVLSSLEPDKTEAWRALGVSFLHALLLDRIVTPAVCGGKTPQVDYVKSAVDAFTSAEQTNGSAFLLQATTMEELRAVCHAGDLMPQKSTYFYPKLASGLVVNPLCPT